MRQSFGDLALLNLVNGSSIAVLTLNDVKDVVAVVLGVVSTISTLLIIRENLRKRARRTAEQREIPEGSGGGEKAKVEEGETQDLGGLGGEAPDEGGTATEPRKKMSEPRLASQARLQNVAQKRRSLSRIEVLVCYLVLMGTLAFTGCTHAGRKQERVDRAVQANRAAIDEESRALTTAVVDTLAGGAIVGTNEMLNLALELARRDQQLEGMPVERIAVGSIVAGEGSARRELEERYDRQQRLLKERVLVESKLEEARGRLVEMGKVYEAERNRNVVRRFWGWLVGTLGVGGLIALCMFCPAVIPILGSMATGLIGKFPALAGYFGVVSRKAFDAVVRGVGEAREKLKKDGASRSGAETLAMLNTELEKATDEEHRRLIEARRRVVNV